MMIRIFLWGLVAAMTLQGFLHADEYGSAPSMMGGMGLTLSVWSESVAEGARGLFTRGPRPVPLPRAVVQAALRETARHPGIHTVPALRRSLEAHERAWAAVRDAEVAWMLEHADLVGAVLVEPDARPLWSSWTSRINRTEMAVSAARSDLCTVAALAPARCAFFADAVKALEEQLGVAVRAERAWRSVLELRGPIDVEWWWSSTHPNSTSADVWRPWSDAVAQLHNVTTPRDPRILMLQERATAMSTSLTADAGWERRLLESLLNGELWSACLQHVGAREGRVRELMTAAGVSELFMAHERALNASLRVLSSGSGGKEADEHTVREWFSEMAGYAWWLGDDIPGLVRRCLGQKTGDCARAGPTEIAALSAQMDERMRIVEDWSRRLFVGMWNALPAVAVLFVVELIMVCIERKVPAAPLQMPPQLPQLQEPRTIILQLQGPSGQIVGMAERQLITA